MNIKKILFYCSILTATVLMISCAEIEPPVYDRTAMVIYNGDIYFCLSEGIERESEEAESILSEATFIGEISENAIDPQNDFSSNVLEVGTLLYMYDDGKQICASCYNYKGTEMLLSFEKGETIVFIDGEKIVFP